MRGGIDTAAAADAPAADGKRAGDAKRTGVGEVGGLPGQELQQAWSKRCGRAQ